MSRPPDSIWGESREEREVVVPLPRKSLIQRDPFEQSTDPDPLLEQLETLRPGTHPTSQAVPLGGKPLAHPRAKRQFCRRRNHSDVVMRQWFLQLTFCYAELT